MFQSMDKHDDPRRAVEDFLVGPAGPAITVALLVLGAWLLWTVVSGLFS